MYVAFDVQQEAIQVPVPLSVGNCKKIQIYFSFPKWMQLCLLWLFIRSHIPVKWHHAREIKLFWHIICWKISYKWKIYLHFSTKQYGMLRFLSLLDKTHLTLNAPFRAFYVKERVSIDWSNMTTPWHVNAFRIIGALCDECTENPWMPRTKDQWCEALVISLLLAWRSCWTHRRVAGDFGRHYTDVASL